MTEREEKIIKKGEKKEEKKPSLWQRMKKPLAAGLLGASLLFSPAKKADAIPILVRAPPPYVAAEVENDKLLKAGWKILQEYSDGKCSSEERLQIAKKIFESVYKRTGNPVALDLKDVTDYYLAVEDRTYHQTKTRLLNRLKSVEERLKSYPDDIRALDKKQETLKSLFEAAHGLYFDKEIYREYRKKDEIDLYYEDAIKYGKELIEFEKEYLESLLSNSKFNVYTSKGSLEIPNTERNDAIKHLKKDLKENENMYEELLKEKRKD
ncbi:MAG: hypothetical protein QXK21_01515 [Candidatus Micrarchaeia archaeon]